MPPLPILRTETCSVAFMAELLALLCRSGFSLHVEEDRRITICPVNVAGTGSLHTGAKRAATAPEQAAPNAPKEPPPAAAGHPRQHAPAEAPADVPRAAPGLVKPAAHDAPRDSPTQPRTDAREDRREMYHGITADDMPGKDVLSRRMNFALFRRGKLKAYKECRKLTGEALKAEFARLNAGQRAKSALAGERRTEKIRLK